ncbi:serine hydrolase [Candidatus Woesearchaeota archaeon]|nr:serine hydrolase [Candidatus Woesearchaeota archaeon]
MAQKQAFKGLLHGVQKGFNSVAPYVLAELGAAAVLHSGIEHGYAAASDAAKNVAFYGSLGLFNAGVLYPVAQESAGNFVRVLLKVPKARKFVLPKNVKTAGLAGLTALGLVAEPVREASAVACEQVYDDVTDFVHFTPHDFYHSGKEESTLEKALSGPGDHTLEQDITAYVNSLRDKGLARPRGVEDYSIFVKDLHSGKVIANIHPDAQRLAASTNKLYVLLAAEHEVVAKKLDYDAKLKSNLQEMIVHSNNSSTDYVIDRIGGANKVNAIVQDYGFDDTTIEKINAAQTGGRTLGNKTSAADLADYFEQLYKGEFPRSSDMRRILAIDGGSGHLDKLVDRNCIPTNKKYLKKTGGYVETVEDKTGYIWGANNDAGILTAHFYEPRTNVETVVPYEVILMINDEDAKPDNFRPGVWGRAKSTTNRVISGLIYDRIQEDYSSLKSACAKGDKK